ncbi:hypothetical protein J6590_036052 [Homalodisca vitripennis]|nr:hypothetical protein J6590_036052 [Homalodisca vitripennis]
MIKISVKYGQLGRRPTLEEMIQATLSNDRRKNAYFYLLGDSKPWNYNGTELQLAGLRGIDVQSIAPRVYSQLVDRDSFTTRQGCIDSKPWNYNGIEPQLAGLRGIDVQSIAPRVYSQLVVRVSLCTTRQGCMEGTLPKLIHGFRKVLFRNEFMVSGRYSSEMNSRFQEGTLPKYMRFRKVDYQELSLSNRRNRLILAQSADSVSVSKLCSGSCKLICAPRLGRRTVPELFPIPRLSYSLSQTYLSRPVPSQYPNFVLGAANLYARLAWAAAQFLNYSRYPVSRIPCLKLTFHVQFRLSIQTLFWELQTYMRACLGRRTVPELFPIPRLSYSLSQTYLSRPVRLSIQTLFWELQLYARLAWAAAQFLNYSRYPVSVFPVSNLPFTSSSVSVSKLCSGSCKLICAPRLGRRTVPELFPIPRLSYSLSQTYLSRPVPSQYPNFVLGAANLYARLAWAAAQFLNYSRYPVSRIPCLKLTFHVQFRLSIQTLFWELQTYFHYFNHTLLSVVRQVCAEALCGYATSVQRHRRLLGRDPADSRVCNLDNTVGETMVRSRPGLACASCH